MVYAHLRIVRNLFYRSRHFTYDHRNSGKKSLLSYDNYKYQKVLENPSIRISKLAQFGQKRNNCMEHPVLEIFQMIISSLRESYAFDQEMYNHRAASQMHFICPIFHQKLTKFSFNFATKIGL